MTNKNQERWSTFQLLAPASVTIASGAVLLFGRGTHVAAGIAAEEKQASTLPASDSNSGYITVDFEGVFNLTVSGTTQSSPSAGAAINRGDAVYADGGTYDATSGVTTGSTLDADSNGTFVGLALDPVAAGVTAKIRVALKNSPV